MGALNFLVVRDGSGLVQAVAESDAEVQALLDAGAALETVIAGGGPRGARPPRRPAGSSCTTCGSRSCRWCTEPPPLALHKRELRASLPVLLDHAVVANRHPTRRALLRLGAGVMAGFRATLEQAGFTEIQTPKLVASATEGGANVFAVDYFGRTAYLAQSPQFYKQIMVGVFERVFEVGPVFRAEPHDTTRHINEYVSLDVELGFIRDHLDVMALLREVLAGIFDRLADAARRRSGAAGGGAAGPCRPPSPQPALHRGAGAGPAAAAAWTAGPSPTCRPRTSARWASGRRRPTAATSCSSPGTPCASGRSTPTPTRLDPSTRTRSTCSSAAPSW